MKTTDLVDNQYLRTDIPELKSGDEVKVHVRVVESGKERIQIFQGNIVAIQGSGIAETYTVRKLSYGVGVERTFPVHSPTVAKLELLRHGDVRRANAQDVQRKLAKSATGNFCSAVLRTRSHTLKVTLCLLHSTSVGHCEH